MSRAEAEEYVRACDEDEGPDTYEEAAEIFEALYGRKPDAEDGDQGQVWSLCCAAVEEVTMSKGTKIETVTTTDAEGTYTYSIFDADPSGSGSCAWPSHDDVEIEADTDEEAIDDVRDLLEVEAAGLEPSDGYEVGQRIYALVWGADGTVLQTISYELTADDLGVEVAS